MFTVYCASSLEGFFPGFDVLLSAFCDRKKMEKKLVLKPTVQKLYMYLYLVFDFRFCTVLNMHLHS